MAFKFKLGDIVRLVDRSYFIVTSCKINYVSGYVFSQGRVLKEGYVDKLYYDDLPEYDDENVPRKVSYQLCKGKLEPLKFFHVSSINSIVFVTKEVSKGVVEAFVVKSYCGLDNCMIELEV